jgi:hypothetical protein
MIDLEQRINSPIGFNNVHIGLIDKKNFISHYMIRVDPPASSHSRGRVYGGVPGISQLFKESSTMLSVLETLISMVGKGDYKLIAHGTYIRCEENGEHFIKFDSSDRAYIVRKMIKIVLNNMRHMYIDSCRSVPLRTDYEFNQSTKRIIDLMNGSVDQFYDEVMTINDVKVWRCKSHLEKHFYDIESFVSSVKQITSTSHQLGGETNSLGFFIKLLNDK